jgi:hypothetical protein
MQLGRHWLDYSSVHPITFENMAGSIASLPGLFLRFAALSTLNLLVRLLTCSKSILPAPQTAASKSAVQSRYLAVAKFNSNDVSTMLQGPQFAETESGVS